MAVNEQAPARPSCHDPYLRCAFFGAAQTAAGVDGACILAHSPQGCELLVSTALEWQQTDYLATKTLCTKLCEDEIVHGGEATLARVIEEAETFNSPVVFVLTACGPEIVGDDIGAVCQEMEQQVPFQLVPIECAGFRGSQYAGIDIALDRMLKSLVGNEHDSKVPGSVVLIAPHASGNPSWPGDLAWVKSILSKFGLTVLTTLAHRSPLEDLRKCAQAEYSLLLSHDAGFQAESYLEQQLDVKPLLGTPGGMPLPIGFSNTGRWLTRLGEVLGQEGLAGDFIDQGETFVVEQLRRQGLQIQFFNGAQIGIMADATLATPLLGAACEDLECEPVLIGVRSGHPRSVDLLKSEAGRLGLNIPINADIDVYEAKRLLSEFRPDAVIGSNIERHLGEEIGLQFLFRVVDPVSRFRMTNRQYFGYTGFLNVLEIMHNDWWDFFRSRRRRYETRW